MTRPEVTWGGRRWEVAVDAATPGLVREGDGLGPLLALAGLSARDRPDDPGAFGGASLVGVERHEGRVEATYEPPNWGTLRVRASWTPRGDVLDLEVQLQGFTVDEPREVEVWVARRPPTADYLEMVHPDDLARSPQGGAIGDRYALFGHDIERGVVLRGRVRGIWFDRPPDEAEVARRRDEFLREPPPLGP